MLLDIDNLSKKSMDEIITKYGQISWAELDDDEKEQWITENLDENEFAKYEAESRKKNIGTNTGSGSGSGKRTTKKSMGRKRKTTRRRRKMNK